MLILENNTLSLEGCYLLEVKYFIKKEKQKKPSKPKNNSQGELRDKMNIK